jgi:hypothetical protein
MKVIMKVKMDVKVEVKVKQKVIKMASISNSVIKIKVIRIIRVVIYLA